MLPRYGVVRPAAKLSTARRVQRGMTGFRRHTSTLALRLLLAVMAINVAFAYGACCTAAASVAVTDQMPCHDAGDDQLNNGNDCCAACFVMSPPPPPAAGALQPGAATPPAHAGDPASETTGPPLRPPIQRLS